jgi:hypothetical protein
MNLAGASDGAVLFMVGSRIRTERLNQNRTQMEVAHAAGIGVRVIDRLENGKGCRLDSFIRILRSLGKIDQLDAFLPDPGISPLQLAHFAGRQRKGASGKRGRPPKIKE